MKTAPQKAPSASSKRFDHDPSDTELTCLLEGSSGVAGGIKIVEADGMLRIRSGLLPVTGIMLSMILGAVFFTGVLILIYKTDPVFFEIAFWGMLAFCWLFLIPFWWIVLVVINRGIAKNDDFIRVDMAKRTLELCGEGRKFQAAEILAFTEVFRYYYYDRPYGDSPRGWYPKLQTGVLVRAADSQTELHALVGRKTRPPLADRLAGIFGVPVRRIKLNKSESRALNDC